jgi:aminoglycoside phosphotransferase (APT) family kinase protein
MSDPDALGVLQIQLGRWAIAHYGAGSTVAGLETMPGHAGLSFGFRVERDHRGIGDFVVRLPPKGVRRSGNTDVLRQVPLLRSLAAHRVPVARVAWFDSDEQWFDVPYLMVDRLPGVTWNVRAASESPGAVDAAAAVFRQAAAALASIHRVPWRDDLADWEPVKDLADEVVFWDRLLEKSADPGWIELGRRVRDLLLSTVPADPVIGIFHGDFQTNNILFHDGRLVAVLDWEISGIGAQLLDLGWLLMMNDPLSWWDGDGLTIVPSFDDIVTWYSEGVGRQVTLGDVAWYRALSGYRFGVISCFNVMLHRTGKRPDAEWDRIAPSVPYLFGRAEQLLGW